MSLRYRTGETTRALALSGLLALGATAAVAVRVSDDARSTDGAPDPVQIADARHGPAGVGLYGQQAPIPGSGEAAREATPPPLPANPLDELRAVIPELPGMTLLPIGALRANDNPMLVATGETTQSPEQVLRFYEAAFSRAGRSPRVEPDGRGGGAVSFYDADRGRLVSVLATPAGSEEHPYTLVFPAITDAREGVKVAPVLPAQLPNAPGAVTVLRLDEARPGPAPLSSTITQLVPGAPAELATWYREALVREGYAVKGQRSTLHNEWLELEQHGELLQLNISRVNAEAKSSTVAFVLEGDR